MTYEYEAIHQAVRVVRSHLPEDFVPKLGIILGTGLGSLGDHIKKLATVPYYDIPGFHASTVPGHPGQLIAGYLEGLPVLCFQGRVHFYEGASIAAMQVMIRTLKFMGAEMLLLTNASGSLREEVKPGRLMLITDHINFQAINPLVGPNDERIGPRFVSMDKIYDVELRERFHQIAGEMQIQLAEGVYFGVLGPTFETPAEIRAFRTLGADAIGMSTVPEVILAKHCGLKIVGLAVITNLAAGMTSHSLTHEEHVEMTGRVADQLIHLVRRFAKSLIHE